MDCGARSKKEVEALGIHIGSVATYEEGFGELAYGYYIGRAMDNRIGGFMIAEVARLLKENKKNIPFGLYIVNAVQEEIGLKGAEMGMHVRFDVLEPQFLTAAFKAGGGGIIKIIF